MTIYQKTTAVLTIVFIAFLSFASMAFAGQTETDKSTWAEAKQEAKEALDAVKEFSADKRDDAVKNVKKTIDYLDVQIAKMQEKLDRQWDSMDEAARKQARATMKSLRESRKDLAEWYGGLKHSSKDVWESVKSGFVKSYDKIVDDFAKAKDDLKDQFDPGEKKQ